MTDRLLRRVLGAVVLAALATAAPAPAAAQILPLPAAPVPTPPDPPAPPDAPPGPFAAGLQVCGLDIPAPPQLPPAGSGPVVYFLIPCFEKQGNVSLVPSETYVFYMGLRPSLPSQGVWTPFNDAARQALRDDFWRLWDTGWLDDLAIEVYDYPFANGVVGKVISYSIEERQRVRVVDYEGSDELDRTAINDQLNAQNLQIVVDDFLDLGRVRNVEAVVRSFMAEKGYTNATVTHTITPTAAGPKVVNVTFHVDQGPKTKIRRVDFVGNVAFSDGDLRDELRQNKPSGFLSFITGDGTYKVDRYEEDVAALMQFYRNRGYAKVRIGQPDLRVLETEPDGETQWVELRIPVTEGARYRLRRLDFDGNEVLPSSAMRPLFDLAAGEWYNEATLREGLETAEQIYGSAGYMEFTGAPDLRFSDDADAIVPRALLAPPGATAEPVVDVVMRVQEGPQYLVNRITFVGNTTTRDNVIRREFRLVEGGVYDTQALDFSIRRVNQLGYFEPVDVENINNNAAITIENTPGRENAVDVTVQLQEQNRNQLTFGAGVSQFEGFFGQLSFQTANFLGRGESLTVSLQGGSRSQNYQLAFTEPFLFDRNITGGFDIYKRELQYIGYYTQKSSGGNVTFGFPTFDFARMFVNYSYEETAVEDLNAGFNDPIVLARNPFLRDSLLIGQGGRRTISQVTPTFLYNTVDNPIFPNTGTRISAEMGLAGLGGNTAFYKPSVEGTWFRRVSSRTSLGFRARFQFIAPWGDTETLPIFEKLFLGGEYDVRGYDIRSIGPSDPVTGLVLGGNKSLLVNAEYIIRVADPVRLIAFADAGQVRAEGEPFAMKEDLIRRVGTPLPLLYDPLQLVRVVDPNAALASFETIGQTSAFKTSLGLEVRFFMPVLNVPFRLIWAQNLNRGNVLDNSLRPAPGNTFKFAVGTTF